MLTMKNGDTVFFFWIALFVVLAWYFMKKYPAVPGGNRESPLDSGMYTSGSEANGMDVTRRKNFRMQPLGGPTTG